MYFLLLCCLTFSDAYKCWMSKRSVKVLGYRLYNFMLIKEDQGIARIVPCEPPHTIHHDSSCLFIDYHSDFWSVIFNYFPWQIQVNLYIVLENIIVFFFFFFYNMTVKAYLTSGSIKFGLSVRLIVFEWCKTTVIWLRKMDWTPSGVKMISLDGLL